MTSPRLLDRTAFRTAVLTRNNGNCCVPDCLRTATDAHHILSRNLFRAAHEFGGYFIENGAGLCGPHHLDAEHTLISVEQLRIWCQITSVVLPEHLTPDSAYDTWGNPILSDGVTRIPGELFDTDGCQKALRPVLHTFQSRFKYPRTPHLPWSPGRTTDDISRTGPLQADTMVVTLKIDGENSTVYPDGYTHARSIDSKPHPSRSALKAAAAQFAPNIPLGYRICLENAYAVHSLRYTDLPAHHLVHSIWNGNTCLSWADTVEWAALLDLNTVPVLYTGPPLNQADLTALFTPYTDTHEGYVVRNANSFPMSEFGSNVAKWVRSNHVITDQHWLTKPVEVNGLAQQEASTP